MKYDLQIQRLYWLISNWELIKENPFEAKQAFSQFFMGRKLFVDSGLCYNCDLYRVDKADYIRMMQTFPKFSGSTNYPLGDYEDFHMLFNSTSTQKDLS